MNFLALAKRLRQEAGISGTGPTTVIDQSGEMGRVVDWIITAYEDIQEEHATWRFLRESFSFTTTATQQAYTPAQAGVEDLATWIRDGMSIYINEADEQYLQPLFWDEFSAGYLWGAFRSSAGRPSIISIKPNQDLILWQIPNLSTYNINGEYYKAPDIMEVANDSTPVIPAKSHMAIVWKALMHYGAYTAAEEKYAHGGNEYDKKLATLELDQLETVGFGEPLV